MPGTQDFAIRALDVRTGKELWKGKLPVGAEATPMTYLSPRSGRQFVVISAGGNSATTHKGDYVVAFALRKPEQRD
ncbi:Quinate/shikimate dehydrogenase (quinone) [compost metagenome]